MAISLIVLLIPVILAALAIKYLYGGTDPVTVDPTETIGSAQRAGLTQLPPPTAPEGWKVVRANFKDGTLRIGYLTQDEKGVQLIQSRSDIATTEQARDGETRLIGRSGDMTVVLLGRNADLGPLAETLPIKVQP